MRTETVAGVPGTQSAQLTWPHVTEQSAHRKQPQSSVAQELPCSQQHRLEFRTPVLEAGAWRGRERGPQASPNPEHFSAKAENVLRFLSPKTLRFLPTKGQGWGPKTCKGSLNPQGNTHSPSHTPNGLQQPWAMRSANTHTL